MMFISIIVYLLQLVILINTKNFLNDSLSTSENDHSSANENKSMMMMINEEKMYTDEEDEDDERKICSSDNEFDPCYCDPYVRSFWCNKPNGDLSYLSLLIKKIENNLFKLNKTSIKFEYHIREMPLKKLDKSKLGKILFDVIAIIGTGLNEIDNNTFLYTSSILELLDLENNLLDERVFSVLNTLPKLSRINLSYNNIRSIPSYAFYNDNLVSNLNEIFLAGNHIHLIKPYAFFNLPKLYKLDLSENQLSSFEKNLFNFNLHSESEKLFDLDLSSNLISFCFINNIYVNNINKSNVKNNNNGSIDCANNIFGIIKDSNNFNSDDYCSDESFLLNLNRATKLKLDKNKIKTLNKTIISEFLQFDKRNELDLKDNLFNCKYCDVHWVKFIEFTYKSRLLNVQCSNIINSKLNSSLRRRLLRI